MQNLAHILFNIKTEAEFTKVALELFKKHVKENNIYKSFVTHLNFNANNVKKVNDIPFLPIEFFKSHTINIKPSYHTFFMSSGTTGQIRSKHFVYDLELYEQSILKGFNYFYGDINQYSFLPLLPGYIDNRHASLIHMMHYLMQCNNQHITFYNTNFTALQNAANECKKKSKIPFVVGVTHALLTMAEQNFTLPQNSIIMETGGMKGKGEEKVREEVHTILTKGLNVEQIHSEYGMTELLSQAYSLSKGIFKTPPWMHVKITHSNDPFTECKNGKAGIINVIDLANAYSCPFIATQDVGKKLHNGSFEVLGRMDHSEVRGCNLLSF